MARAKRKLTPDLPRLVELSFGLYFVGVVAVGIVFTFYPRKILEHLQ